MSLGAGLRRARPLCRVCLSTKRLARAETPSSRPAVSPLAAARSFTTSPIVLRKGGPSQPARRPGKPTSSPRNPRSPVKVSVNDFASPAPLTALDVVRLILTRLDLFAHSQRLHKKLAAYGFSSEIARSCSEEWSAQLIETLDDALTTDQARAALREAHLDIDRLLALDPVEYATPLEAILLRHLLSFSLTRPLPSHLSAHISSILAATDLSRLPFEGYNLGARAMSRHFHLHIGPTNSGKTYNALKALSKAGTGAYAGPLRLLAHEVWERLNLGTVGDLNGEGRECNLLTGEERRVVDPDAGLISCTVEMLPPSNSFSEPFDVVVIDEIQMLGDPQRGGSWTSAVMGVQAKEVHLCGDETTVELLKRMIGSFGGDKLTINRYNRLTPLAVADQSLEGDLAAVEPGDCIVTFSRTNIFNVKRDVEKQAGRKCAVVYGALPPETRAEQARDFNADDGQSEVLVASDAVGMGLNLKIRRMIFESLHKYNGKTDVPLALTQIKQIAGRAGRFGMSPATSTAVQEPRIDAERPSLIAPDEKPAAGGIVTTLHEADLPVLRQLLPMPLPSISQAVLDVPFDTLARLSSLLPPSTTFADLLDHLSSLILPPRDTVLSSQHHKLPLAEVLEPMRQNLSLGDLDLFTFSPVSVRDPRAVAIFRLLVETFAAENVVLVDDIFRPSGLLGLLKEVEDACKDLAAQTARSTSGQKGFPTPFVPSVLITSLPSLETLHKALVLYIWLSYRVEVSFPERDKAVAYKERAEVVLEKCLENLPGLRKRRVKGMMNNQQVGNLLGQLGGLGKQQTKKIQYEDHTSGRKNQLREAWRNVAVVRGK